MLRNSLRGISKCVNVKFVYKYSNYNVVLIHGERQSKCNPTYRRVVMPNDMTLNPKPRNAIENMLCPYTSLGKFYDIICCLMSILILILTFL